MCNCNNSTFIDAVEKHLAKTLFAQGHPAPDAEARRMAPFFVDHIVADLVKAYFDKEKEKK